jgi:hypothetical protein
MALAKFVDSFVMDEPTVMPLEQSKPILRKLISKPFKWIVFTIVLLTMLLLFKSYFKSTGVYHFSCDNQQDTYPFTATFRYDISEVDDSVFTDFGNREETYLSPQKRQINHFYSNTGVYWPKFYTRHKVLDSLRITAFATDWQGGFYPNMKPEMFQSFHDQIFYRLSDFFYALPSLLKNEGADLNLKFWTAYKYFTPFGKSLDNLSLDTRVENNASTGSLTCYDTEIILIGDSGTVDFKFTQPKCSRWASLKVSEKYITGEFNDLSAFTVDMSDWLQISMTTAKGNCTISLDNKPIYTQQYHQPLGNLIGVVYQFYGSGKIDYLHLKDATGDLFYSNEFRSSFQ